MENKIQLNTNVSEDGIINQELLHCDNGYLEKMKSWIINTREKEFKKALIKLGWTPPKIDHIF